MKRAKPVQSARDPMGRFGAGLAIFTAIFTANTPTPLYGYYQELWGFSAAALTGAFAVYAVGVLAALLTVSPLSDRLGRRPLILMGLALVACGALIFWQAQSWWWLLAARLVGGLGTGTLTAAATAMLVESDPADDRRRAGVIATLCFAAGATSGPGISALGFQFGLWPTVLPHLLTVLFAGVAITLVARARETAPAMGPPGAPLQLLPRVPATIRFTFAMGALGLSLGWTLGALYASLGPSLALELLGVRERGLASLFAAAFQGMAGLSQLVFRARPAQVSLSVGPILLLFGLVVGLSALHWSSPSLFAVATVVLAAGTGSVFCGSVGLVSLAAPEAQRGEVFSALYVIAYIAISVPIFLVGLGADLVDLHTAFVVFAGAVGVGALVLALSILRLSGRLSIG